MNEKVKKYLDAYNEIQPIDYNKKEDLFGFISFIAYEYSKELYKFRNAFYDEVEINPELDNIADTYNQHMDLVKYHSLKIQRSYVTMARCKDFDKCIELFSDIIESAKFSIDKVMVVINYILNHGISIEGVNQIIELSDVFNAVYIDLVK